MQFICLDVPLVPTADRSVPLAPPASILPVANMAVGKATLAIQRLLMAICRAKESHKAATQSI